MTRLPPISTRPTPLFPYTTLFRSKRDVDRPITDHRTVERFIAMLEPHEQQVVRLRIGLGPSPALTLAATAKIVGVSPSRIGQIEDKAFRRIRWVDRKSTRLNSSH